MSDKKYYHTLDEYAYFGNDLGAVYSKEKTVFKVWSPSASAVESDRELNRQLNGLQRNLCSL